MAEIRIYGVRESEGPDGGLFVEMPVASSEAMYFTVLIWDTETDYEWMADFSDPWDAETYATVLSMSAKLDLVDLTFDTEGAVH